MDAPRQFLGQNLMNNSMALNSAFASKSRARYVDAKMAFSIRVMTAMPGVLGRFVDNDQPRRRQSCGNLAFNRGLDGPLTEICHFSDPYFRSQGCLGMFRVGAPYPRGEAK